MGSRGIRLASDDVASGIDPGGGRRGGSREVDRREGTAVADESVLAGVHAGSGSRWIAAVTAGLFVGKPTEYSILRPRS